MTDASQWYVAVLVLKALVHAPSPDAPLFDHQIRLLRADDPESAYQRALFLGRSEEQSYSNPLGQKVDWQFVGLHDLRKLDDALERDGVEVHSFQLRDGREFEVLPKDKLTVFWLASLLDRPIAE